ncbi:MAG: hypothetical protein LC754_19070 [Acidobacteria bacterium]|nr:hypothetical protein [Acidobacteriota bacterium]
MNEDIDAKSTKPTSVMRRFITYAGVLLVVFLLGLVPMWLQYRASAGRLADAEQRLTLITMQRNLASAAVDARRGDYEPARQSASQFFTSLRAEIDKGETSAFTQTQRGGMQPLFDGRDEIITLLARSDPASADRLSDLYVAYRKVVGG